MNMFIPVWIIGGPFLGLLILFFSFRGPSAMSGSMPRAPVRGRELAVDRSSPLLDPVHPDAPRRHI